MSRLCFCEPCSEPLQTSIDVLRTSAMGFTRLIYHGSLTLSDKTLSTVRHTLSQWSLGLLTTNHGKSRGWHGLRQSPCFLSAPVAMKLFSSQRKTHSTCPWRADGSPCSVSRPQLQVSPRPRPWCDSPDPERSVVLIRKAHYFFCRQLSRRKLWEKNFTLARK